MTVLALHHMNLRVSRQNKLERFAFGVLTGTTPEHYIKTMDIVGPEVYQFGKHVAKEITIDAMIRGTVWVLNRSKYVAPRVAARAIPYAGWGMLAYDIYQIFD
jgi:hypothetical protein